MLSDLTPFLFQQNSLGQQCDKRWRTAAHSQFSSVPWVTSQDKQQPCQLRDASPYLPLLSKPQAAPKTGKLRSGNECSHLNHRLFDFIIQPNISTFKPVYNLLDPPLWQEWRCKFQSWFPVSLSHSSTPSMGKSPNSPVQMVIWESERGNLITQW